MLFSIEGVTSIASASTVAGATDGVLAWWEGSVGADESTLGATSSMDMADALHYKGRFDVASRLIAPV